MQHPLAILGQPTPAKCPSGEMVRPALGPGDDIITGGESSIMPIGHWPPSSAADTSRVRTIKGFIANLLN
jgi:hypothetical protein